MNTIVPLLIGCAAVSVQAAATSYEPERKGATIYVSKLGDDSDGSSWAKAFTTIQAALQGVPDDQGGHRVVVRPDTYVEANLYPSHKGAKGSYNMIMGDHDGSLGSGATGWVIIDAGCPDVVVRVNREAGGGNPPFKILDAGGPEKGLKSIDWWGTWRCEPDFSAVIWDRWIFRCLYATGAEGGMGWDMTCEKGAKFSVLVEDCFGIGRAFGGIVGAFTSRPDEPCIFRRCQLWSLDWWGDASGMYVRAETPAMPDHPDVVMEDCVMVGPQCSLKAGNPGYAGYSRVKLKNCNLVTLNFSQPHGTPTDGIIQSVVDGKFLHVDLEDCTLMGYKVFGVRVNKETAKDIGYTVQGSVRAYVQFQQEVPEGFERLALWPKEVFETILPPNLGAAMPTPLAPSKLAKLPTTFGPARMEQTPVIYQGRPLMAANFRGCGATCKAAEMYLCIEDLRTGQEVARLGTGHSFVSAFVNGDEMNVFGTEYTDDDWTHDIYRFSSTDLKTWKRELVIAREEGQHLFNASVCQDNEGYVMAYESNVPVQWTFQFARSKDLAHWEKVDGLVFADLEGRCMSACPALRYIAPYYYVIYTIARSSRIGDTYAYESPDTRYVPVLARSMDLVTWELSPLDHPFLDPAPGEGINNSDVDLFELDGTTYVFYATGDQSTWGTVRIAMYPGPMKACFESHFPPNTPMVRFNTKEGKYVYPEP